MMGIFLGKVRLFLRSPWTFVATTAMSIGFALILGGANSTIINVPVYLADEEIHDSVVWDVLEESDVYHFKTMTKEELNKKILNGKAELGLELGENNFRILVGVKSQNIGLVEQTVKEAYLKKLQYEEIYAAAGATTLNERSGLQKDLQHVQENPPFLIQSHHFRGSDAVIIDSTFQSLFGFTLFFAIYTIAYNVFHILVEKREGLWDRIILSPVKKWEMYAANFVYSFLTGYLQVAIVFFVFRYLVGVDFNGNFVESLILIIPYVFAIVALSILITGLVKTVQQFNAIIPIIAVSLAMIGGAYWPLEVVESKFMLALSKIDPITYGMEALNGVAIYGYSLGETLYPISILLLMGVVMTGLGIHLMEKRHV